MDNIRFVRLTFTVLGLTLCLLSCRKEGKLNIKLRGTSLQTTKSYIQGKWQFHYAYGGYTGNTIYTFKNSFIEFKKTDSVYWRDDTGVLADNEIEWRDEQDIHDGNTRLKLMLFFDYRQYPFTYTADQIKDDTLVLDDNTYDGMLYYLTRSSQDGAFRSNDASVRYAFTPLRAAFTDENRHMW